MSTTKGDDMSLVMMKGTYTQQGWQGVAKEGFQSREDTIRAQVQAMGGELIGLYFSTNADWDWMVIADGSDVDLIAQKLQIMASGAYGWVTADVVVTAATADSQTAPVHRTPGE